jgi:hypothetical protein
MLIKADPPVSHRSRYVAELGAAQVRLSSSWFLTKKVRFSVALCQAITSEPNTRRRRAYRISATSASRRHSLAGTRPPFISMATCDKVGARPLRAVTSATFRILGVIVFRYSCEPFRFHTPPRPLWQLRSPRPPLRTSP